MLIAPWLASALPGAIAGVFGAGGQLAANRANRAEAARNRQFQSGQAQEQMAFQERMRNTSWQAGIADMEAAGLNPALAYSQGGASVPGGASGSGSQAAPAGDLVGSAMQAMQMRKTLKLLDEQVAKTREEKRSAQATADVEEARSGMLTRGKLAEDIGTDGVSGPTLLRRLVESEVQSGMAGAQNLRAQEERTRSLTRMQEPIADLADRFGEFLPILSLLMAPGGAAGRLLGGGVKAVRGIRTRRFIKGINDNADRFTKPSFLRGLRRPK